MALFFNDNQAAADILKLTNPVEIKNRAKRINGFNKERWEEVCEAEITPGIKEKFRQNQAAKDYLLATGTKDIIEASPHDKFYGIGMGLRNKDLLDKQKWGNNLMGKILVGLRQEFVAEPWD